MTTRHDIANMISGILSERGSYPAVPKRLTDHIVTRIEHPLKRSSYRTGTLLQYLSERKMKLEVCNRIAGYRAVVSENSGIHAAIRYCMGFYNLRDNDLTCDGLEYHCNRDSDASISMDRCLRIFDKLYIEINITDE